MKLKKPDFWDHKKPNTLSHILYPVSKIIEILSRISFTKRKKLNTIKTICIGNIYIGGTGKTSLAIEMKKMFDEKKIKSCFIKKFYSDQFDEHNLLKKFGKVFSNNSRLKALQQAELEDYKVAIFDDGLQDKTISYDLSFVCFNKKNFIGNGFLIPAGPLRENLKNINEYKNIFLIGNHEDAEPIIKKLIKQGDKLNFFEAEYSPLNLKDFDLKSSYVVFSGIGNHGTFIDMLRQYNFNIIQDLEFPDHYDYSIQDIEKIKNTAKNNNLKILTTEKDFLRLNIKDREEIKFIKTFLKIKNIEKINQKLNTINENS